MMKGATKRRNKELFLAKQDEKERMSELRDEIPAKQDEEDRISELPDEILISIISRLPLKEATSTSILSTRWRYLHTSTTRLDFPPFRRRQNRNVVNIINGVLGSHRGGRLVRELKLHILYNLEGGGTECEKWVEFALSREVEMIDIKIHDFSYSNRYNLGLSKLTKLVEHPLPSFKCLNQLRLYAVQVDDQDFELLISKFVALETLSLNRSHVLRNVSIVGHPKLKHLEMDCISCLRTFEVREVINLVSLRCSLVPKACVVNFENVPKLAHFTTDRWYFPLLSSIRDQLQIQYITLKY